MDIVDLSIFSRILLKNYEKFFKFSRILFKTFSILQDFYLFFQFYKSFFIFFLYFFNLLECFE